MSPEMTARVAELLAEAPEVTDTQAAAAARILAQPSAALRPVRPLPLTPAADEPIEQQAA